MIPRYLYNTAGHYVAFEQEQYIFSPEGEWICFLQQSNQVYKVNGAYLGTLVDDDRIVRDSSAAPLPPTVPIAAPSKPVLPEKPLQRLKMTPLPPPLQDVFDKGLSAGLHAPEIPFEKFFLTIDANIDGDNTLREPQKEGYHRAYEYFHAHNNHAIIQLPVGCGKTGLAAILPLDQAEGRVLLLAPNLTIKNELFRAMDITNRQKCFWRKSGVLKPEQMTHGPFACTLDSGNVSVAKLCHIVITNIQQLATNEEKWLKQFPPSFFDMIIVDEAHHSAAKTWESTISRFPAAKIVFLTATPFRSDRKELKGEIVYRFPFRTATLKGYIKRLKASYVAPSTVSLSFNDKDGQTYSLEEVLTLKEKDWFSRAIAMSQKCNAHIVDVSLSKLEELRQSGTQHQLIAVACSINHAQDIRALYAERGYSAAVIHSNMKNEEQESILLNLRNGSLDCIIQVQMLGEGFDHPKLSVAAIFRPFRTLAPYVQFVGRILRVIVQNDPRHPDNLGYIVTHLGMNLDERLREFKDFEKDDQDFWDRVISATEPEVPSEVREGRTRLRSSEKIVVFDEMVDSLWEEDFTDPEDEQIVAQLREQMTLLGLDASVVEEMVQKAKRESSRKSSPAEPFPILPQKQWEEAKKRLNEQSKRLANILLNHVELTSTGTELPYKYKTLRLSGRNNFICALMMVNKKIQDELGKARKDASTNEFKDLLDNLDGRILQPLVKQIRMAKSHYEQSETDKKTE